MLESFIFLFFLSLLLAVLRFNLSKIGLKRFPSNTALYLTASPLTPSFSTHGPQWCLTNHPQLLFLHLLNAALFLIMMGSVRPTDLFPFAATFSPQ